MILNNRYSKFNSAITNELLKKQKIKEAQNVLSNIETQSPKLSEKYRRYYMEPVPNRKCTDDTEHQNMKFCQRNIGKHQHQLFHYN